MHHLSSRREFVKCAITLASAAPLLAESTFAADATAGARKMRISLSPGAVGIKAGARECVALAQKFGFEAVEPNEGFLARLSDTERAEFLANLKAKGLVFGTAGLPVDFRVDDAKFRSDMAGLAEQMAVLQKAGVDRVGTWVSPGHADLTYQENLRRHAARLGEVAKVLGDHGQRLGLEYVGTPTARQKSRYPFIHSMREMRELISAIALPNVGLVLDSWHWWTAGEGEAELLALKAADVVSVDLNDAPAGIALDKQQDGQRELPCSTGVIPMGVLVNALQKIGYDGPVRAEPFNKPLNEMDTEAACAAVIASLRKAMALLK